MRPALFAMLWLLPSLAAADESALLRCRAVAEPDARLACYDAIPLPDRATGTSAATAPAASPRVAPAVPHSARPASAEPDAASKFGLRSTRREAVDSIRSELAEGFRGWGPGSRIALANGQVWKVVDGTSGVVGRTLRAVTVKRGFMGAYYLHFEGMNTAPKVERVR